MIIISYNIVSLCILLFSLPKSRIADVHGRRMRHLGRTAELLDGRQAVLDVHQPVLHVPSTRIRVRGRHHSAGTASVSAQSSATSAGGGTGNGRGTAVGERVQRFPWHGTGATNWAATTMMRVRRSVLPRRQGAARGARGSG